MKAYVVDRDALLNNIRIVKEKADGTPLFPADYIFGKHIHNTPDSENDTPA